MVFRLQRAFVSILVVGVNLSGAGHYIKNRVDVSKFCLLLVLSAGLLARWPIVCSRPTGELAILLARWLAGSGEGKSAEVRDFSLPEPKV